MLTHHVVRVLEGADGAEVALVHAGHAAQAHALEVGGHLAQHAPVQGVEEAACGGTGAEGKGQKERMGGHMEQKDR